MPAAVKIIRRDYTSEDLRMLSGKARTPEATQRMLAIANVLDGMKRKDAARLAGMDRQALRDWVHRYNDEGIEGLYNRRIPGKPSRLTDEQKAEIKEIVLTGPDPQNGLVRWRCCDIQCLIQDNYTNLP